QGHGLLFQRRRNGGKGRCELFIRAPGKLQNLAAQSLATILEDMQKARERGIPQMLARIERRSLQPQAHSLLCLILELNQTIVIVVVAGALSRLELEVQNTNFGQLL